VPHDFRVFELKSTAFEFYVHGFVCSFFVSFFCFFEPMRLAIKSQIRPPEQARSTVV
jgi:hypothetical protein